MASIGSIVDLVHPTVSGVGVITSDQIWVLFDRELDETTVEDNFFVTGPDYDTWSGPDLTLFNDSDTLANAEDILESPGLQGIVQGTTTFERISLTALTSVSGTDTAGSGHLYRTKAIFTPTNRLGESTDYQVYLTGDEDSTDSIDTGISDRTVFDTLASGNAGTGDVSFTGPYIGNASSDTYRLEITTSGDVDTAKFTFVTDVDPTSVYGPFRTRRAGVLLSDGVTAVFEEGDYVPGDQWSVVVKERNIYTGNLTWPFTTGTGSIVDIPTTTATSVIGDPVTTSTSTSSSSSFAVSSTSPVTGTSNINLPTGEYDITVEFDSDIDVTTVVSGVDVVVYSESVTGETSVAASGTLISNPSVSGSTLTITVASGMLLNNNLVTVTLDSSIANTSGVTLGSDYEFWFTMAYTPMYCALRQTRMRIGAFISSVSDDTINLALHMASKEADALTWNRNYLTDSYFQFARSQWTCCRAAQMILINTVGGSSALRAKKLGDLEVQYNTTDVSIPLQRAEECMAKWEGALVAGGRQVQTPTFVVKGDWDIDKPPIGRGWMHTRSPQSPSTPAANQRSKPSIYSRRYRGWYSQGAGRKGWWDR